MANSIDQSSRGTVDPTIIKAENLWFKDCGLVIRSGNIVFRVSGEILAAKSSVFQDMLRMPQPRGGETFDGCAVVCLPDDPRDTTVFLRVIFDSEFFEPYPAKTGFDTIHGVLRLSNKYLVDYLRRRALIHLSCRFPTTLDGWMSATPTSWTIEPDLLIPVINLAREVSALWILPAVFYSLCINTPHHFGALARGVPFPRHRRPPRAARPRDRPRGLPRAARFPERLPGCMTSARCYAARSAERKYREGLQYQLGYRPLELWGDAEWRQLPPTICTPCVEGMKGMHYQAIQNFWDDLPAKYRLPCWEDLEQMKDVALL
ncbi:BTB domain-containing protein [Mycena sanguinolenta]|uniref:BTB domain-containing protein n=1 Tax=Mycena sanguinolenta TaxID=230812 RepID=A0A8H6YSB2_9AGAR|nr:BTB domain-containing protein [Mycena sanguinolenta]